MISALHAIDGWVTRAQVEPSSAADPLATFKIAGQTGGIMHLFASHPPIEERIAALERALILTKGATVMARIHSYIARRQPASLLGEMVLGLSGGSGPSRTGRDV